MSNPAIDIASTIQSASIKRHPSPAHDVNPSTSASTKRPVEPASPTSVISENSIPESALKPAPRRANLPPLPDLRFEQSYLASIKGAETWSAVAWITVRDQVCAFMVANPNPKAHNLGALHVYSRDAMDTGAVRMETMEPDCLIPRGLYGEQNTTLVVGRQ